MSDIDQLISKIQSMPYGSARVEAARSLWQTAQADPSPEVRYKALDQTLTSAVFGGAAEYFLSLFPMLVRLKQEHPEVVDLAEYAWRIKWLIGQMPSFPEIPLDRIEQAEQHYADTLRQAGGSQRTALYFRWKNARRMGRFELAEPLKEQFQSMRRDRHSDCIACEVNTMVRETLHDDDYAAALEVGEPVLSGRMRCAEVPHATFGEMVLPALLNGDVENARRYHQKGYSLIRSNIGHLDVIGRHLGYLAAAGDADRGLRLLRTHACWLEQNRNPADHLDFLEGAVAVLRLLVESGTRKRPLKLDLPSRWLDSWGNAPLPVKVLAEHLEREARQLASVFDKRNGNSWRITRFERTLSQIREHQQKNAVS